MKKTKLFHYSLAILCFLAACHVSNNAKDSRPLQLSFDAQGHRGSRGLMPENTWPAMKKALDLNVTTLEMDVVVTKDKQLVLSHEQWFGKDITTKPDGTFIGEREERKFNIYWMTYEDVKTFDVGMKPHPRFPQQEKMKIVKPLLTMVLDSVAEYMKTGNRAAPYFNIETKSDPNFDGVFQPKPDEFIELLVATIREKKVEDRVIIQSFDFRTLQYLHEKYPAIKTAMLIEGNDPRTLEAQVKALGFTPTIYSPAHELVTEKLVQKCHKQKMKIIPWTVNDKQRITDLKGMGVDGIISDYPNLFD